ncbi:hypothetical protein [Alkalihalobacillus sp. BA299]|uniref:hypothetical protein n=1 Tax=Alkalihalobacillus sp. BA299 TaxID=2815938 RepID=UPI001ADB58EA|nr:hypothetical protein [Alkalihalobacillus sp. BA299]
MTTQVKQKAVNKDMQEEMVGVLTAISIVSKRLANRLSQLDEQNEKKGEKANEQNKTRS